MTTMCRYCALGTYVDLRYTAVLYSPFNCENVFFIFISVFKKIMISLNQKAKKFIFTA